MARWHHQALQLAEGTPPNMVNHWPPSLVEKHYGVLREEASHPREEAWMVARRARNPQQSSQD